MRTCNNILHDMMVTEYEWRGPKNCFFFHFISMEFACVCVCVFLSVFHKWNTIFNQLLTKLPHWQKKPHDFVYCLRKKMCLSLLFHVFVCFDLKILKKFLVCLFVCWNLNFVVVVVWTWNFFILFHLFFLNHQSN